MGMVIRSFRFGGDESDGTDPNFSDVVLLLGFNGADGSTTITDEGPVGQGNASIGGGAAIDTAQAKFGTGSLLLNGTTDFISYGDSPDWTFGGTDDFTIEAWIRLGSTAGTQTVISQYTDTFSNRSWVIHLNATDLSFTYNTNGGAGSNVNVVGSWTPATGTDYHVAVDCDAARKCRVYVDGVMIASATSFPAIHNSDSLLRIGAIGGPNTNFFNGWIDEVRITKGTARYASDGGFTPPAAAFPRS